MSEMGSFALKTSAALAGFACLATPQAMAQNMSGIFSPVVKDGERSAQYRLGFSEGEDGADDRWRHRLHYQQAINDDLRWRVIVQGDTVETGDFEPTVLRAELQWQIQEAADAGWDSAFRFDGALAEGDDGASFFAVGWTNQKTWGPWRARGIIRTNVQLGDRARDGLFLATRAELSYKGETGPRIGAQMFNSYGSTDALGSFNDQNHQIGPFVSGDVTDSVDYVVGVLFGASDRARDADIRFWLGRSF